MISAFKKASKHSQVAPRVFQKNKKKKNGRTKSRSSGHFPEVPCSLVSLSLWTYKFIAIVNTLPSALRALALSLSLSLCRIIFFFLSLFLSLFFLFITSNKNLVALCSTSRKAYVFSRNFCACSRLYIAPHF